MSFKPKNIPTKPGCYFFKDEEGKLLYIGKAKNLKKRVASYFQKKPFDVKTRELVSRIANVDFVVTSSELDALLTEAKLIQHHQPQYNVQFKGGERYAYIKITKEDYPRLETVRAVTKNDRVYGPYAAALSRRQTLWLANKLFQLRMCRHATNRSCLLCRLHNLSDSSGFRVSPGEYAERINKAELLLKGKNKELEKQLEVEMEEASKNKDYGAAKVRRDQLEALRNIADKQLLKFTRTFQQDVVAAMTTRKSLVVQLFSLTKGIISDRREYKLSRNTDLADFIKQYYYENKEIPEEVILTDPLTDQSLIEKYLSKLAGHKVKITIPKAGNKKKLLKLLQENLMISISRGQPDLLALQKSLSLPTLPRRIEMFDISNLGATNTVGSMVYFHDGEPDKDNYRKFKIKWVRGQSDYDSMKEVVYRRYYRLVKEKATMPDLVIVDGGKPQLSAALRALRELGIMLPVAALAKKEEEIFLPGRKYSVKIPKENGAIKLIQRIRDEAHRFAITYHRLLRSKEMKE